MSPASLERLKGCHQDLIELIVKVDKYYSVIVLEGHRGKEKQNQYFKEGKSKLQWPNGEHNGVPSRAVDVAFLPIDWNDYKKWYHFAGFVLGVAKTLGIEIRWGGDWDSDMDFRDQKFMDLVHFELKE